MQKILVIDDDRDMCLLLKRFLDTRGFNVSLAFNSKQALEILELTEPHLVLCDFRLDNNDGKTMLLRIKEIYADLPVIIITGYSDIRIAVEVMKLGAYDYITKPIFPDEILLTINNALNKADKKSGAAARTSISKPAESASPHEPSYPIPYIFEKSEALQHIDDQINEASPTFKSVIIYGESGSGKEVIAREIHKRSTRNHRSFIAIDCGAISKEIAGSELFGQEKGVLAGVSQQKTGSFELAHGGTIFLDEIANLSHDIQLSLLRVIEERKMRRIGGVKDIEVDVRFIIANNENLPDTVKKGKFREDLFHRFNDYSITVPPLRERREDIMLFANHFLQLINKELEKNILGFSVEVEEILKNYLWYGNLRELKNVIKRAVLLTDGQYIEDRSLPFEISNFDKLLFANIPDEHLVVHQISASLPTTSIPRTLLHENTLKEVSIDAEYEMILEALKQTNFNKSKAARSLNIDRKTLYNKMKQYEQLNNY